MKQIWSECELSTIQFSMLNCYAIYTPKVFKNSVFVKIKKFYFNILNNLEKVGSTWIIHFAHHGKTPSSRNHVMHFLKIFYKSDWSINYCSEMYRLQWYMIYYRINVRKLSMVV